MLPAAKHYVAITPQSATNGATVGGTSEPVAIDTLGYDFAMVTVFGGTTATTSQGLSVLTLKEADVTNTSSFANVSGAVSGTDFTIVASAYSQTANNNIWSFNVDLRGRKRYLRVYASPTTTQLLAGIATLTRGEQAPITAAKANCLQLVSL
jgi:hypothetical protein